MEIHKPKPWHGWREFLKEYLIIVVGVLTALAAEQGVEWLHWQHVVERDHQALTQEGVAIYGAMLARVDQQECIDRRLADIAIILKRHREGKPLRITGPVGRPSKFFPNVGAFDMAMSDQAFSHMSQEEKSRFYARRSVWLAFEDNEKSELEAWRTLKGLDHVDALTPNRWDDVSSAFDRANDLNDVLRANVRYGGNWLEPFTSLPQPAKQNSNLRFMPWVRQLCASPIVSEP